MFFISANDSLLSEAPAWEMPLYMQVLCIVAATASVLLLLAAQFMLFHKAGEKGWKSLIPFYGSYLFVKLIDGKGIKFLLLLIPLVSTVYSIILSIRLAKSFGKGVGFGIGIFFLPIIFIPVLAFASYEYIGARGITP